MLFADKFVGRATDKFDDTAGRSRRITRGGGVRPSTHLIDELETVLVGLALVLELDHVERHGGGGLESDDTGREEGGSLRGRNRLGGKRAMSSGFLCRQQRRVIATRGAPSHELPARAEYYVAETSFKHLARAKPAEDSPRVAGSRAKAGVLLISATQSREISHLASIGGGGHGDGRLGLGGGLRLDEGLAGEHGSSGGNGSHFDEYKARLRSGSVRI